MTAFDPSTYVPGDPWTAPDFLTRARSCPRITTTDAGVGATTPPSYFEFREGGNGQRVVEVSVIGTAPLTVLLERSLDAGVTWQTIETFTAPVETEVKVSNWYMLRLRVTVGTGLTLRLHQDT